jgi:hypothetical protein
MGNFLAAFPFLSSRLGHFIRKLIFLRPGTTAMSRLPYKKRFNAGQHAAFVSVTGHYVALCSTFCVFYISIPNLAV